MSHRKSDLGIPCSRKICQSSARTRGERGFFLTPALSTHRAKILPLVHDAAIGKSAHAVLAARTVTDLRLAAALGADHRRRIGKRPGALRGRKQKGNKDEPDSAPHSVLPVGTLLQLIISKQRQIKRDCPSTGTSGADRP